MPKWLKPLLGRFERHYGPLATARSIIKALVFIASYLGAWWIGVPLLIFAETEVANTIGYYGLVGAVLGFAFVLSRDAPTSSNQWCSWIAAALGLIPTAMVALIQAPAAISGLDWLVAFREWFIRTGNPAVHVTGLFSLIGLFGLTAGLGLRFSQASGRPDDQPAS